MTTDASTFAAARPFSLNVSPAVLGVAALAASIVLLLVVIVSPGARASEPDFSPAAISMVRHFNMRMSEMSSVYIETASSREERPPPAPPAPVARAAAQPVVPAPTRDQVVTKGKMTATLTFYDCLVQKFCGAMSNGQKVYEGAAACSYNLAIGTMFTIAGDPTGRVYVCKDRGLLPNTHVDIFWNDPADGWRWQRAVGSRGTIEIVELPR
ncbi:MAG TPA: hypothetical protein VH951_11630 [Dehalococcoidia bacterium]